MLQNLTILNMLNIRLYKNKTPLYNEYKHLYEINMLLITNCSVRILYTCVPCFFLTSKTYTDTAYLMYVCYLFKTTKVIYF